MGRDCGSWWAHMLCESSSHSSVPEYVTRQRYQPIVASNSNFSRGSWDQGFMWNILIINTKDCLEPIQIFEKINLCSVQAKYVCRLLSAFGSAFCHLCSLDLLFPALIPWVITDAELWAPFPNKKQTFFPWELEEQGIRMWGYAGGFSWFYSGLCLVF